MYLDWFRRFSRRLERPAPSHSIAALAASAAEIRQAAEPQFLQLANDLKALHEAASALSGITREQVSLVRSLLVENRLTGENGLAERSLEELNRSLGQAETRGRMLQHNGEAMRRLSAHGGQMQRVASLLDVSGYGFAVEIARSAAGQQAFDTFVAEVRKLAARVRVLGESIASEAEAARDESERLDRAVWTSHSGLRELTAQGEAAVRQTSQRVEAALDSSWNALQEVEQHSARIAAYAHEAVYHLQFGDIVRQKLEHIEAALGEPAPTGVDQVLSVQVAQLDLIAEEIASAHRQIQQAFAGLAGEAGLLSKAIGHFGGAAGRTAGEKDAIDDLRTAFLKIDELRRHGRELCVKAEETSARAVATAGRLSRYLNEVEEINRQMQRQALNAIIKTVQLGSEGRTLEVLSMYVQRLFEESSGLVSSTVAVIESITASQPAAGPVWAGEADGTSAALVCGLDRLSGAHEQLSRAMTSAAVHAGDHEHRLERARESLAFLSRMGGKVADLRKSVVQARGKAAPAGESVRPAAPLAGGTERYTIASERAVHRRLAGAGEPQAVPSEMVGLAAPELEDALGDNVELF